MFVSWIFQTYPGFLLKTRKSKPKSKHIHILHYTGKKQQQSLQQKKKIDITFLKHFQFQSTHIDPGINKITGTRNQTDLHW